MIIMQRKNKKIDPAVWRGNPPPVLTQFSSLTCMHVSSSCVYNAQMYPYLCIFMYYRLRKMTHTRMWQKFSQNKFIFVCPSKQTSQDQIEKPATKPDSNNKIVKKIHKSCPIVVFKRFIRFLAKNWCLDLSHRYLT